MKLKREESAESKTSDYNSVTSESKIINPFNKLIIVNTPEMKEDNMVSSLFKTFDKTEKSLVLP